MVNVMLQELASRIQTGLNRASIVDAGRWANQYRMMAEPYPGKWSFRSFPWLERMHKLTEEETVGQKAAQMGFTEWALNIAFYFMDVLRRDVLYVLPNSRPVASDFSITRFDKAVELSPHLKRMFSDTSNVGLKRSGTANFYLRGSNSESGLVSIPVSLVILDELERMVQENVPLALERTAGQVERRHVMLSTPSVHGEGINALFLRSTQDHWCFRCPSCSRHIELKFPDNIVIYGQTEFDPEIKKTHLICNLCKATLHHQDKINFLSTKNADWVSNQASIIRGYYVNQLYAMNLPPYEVAKYYFKSLTDPAYEQQFWNSKMGMAHIVASYQLTEEMIKACIQAYDRLVFDRQHFVTMGVDQGKKLHVEIVGWQVGQIEGNDVNMNARARVLNALELDEFEQLDRLMYQYGVRFCVIDGYPETRKAREFAARFAGRVKLCRYPNGQSARSITVPNDDQAFINVDRTSWLDQALGRFRYGTIDIPRNLDRNYVSHIGAQMRIPYKDQYGNTMARYITPANKEDHYGHARVYSEVALPLALGVGVSVDIKA